jgi:hypothetical protein
MTHTKTKIPKDQQLEKVEAARKRYERIRKLLDRMDTPRPRVVKHSSPWVRTSDLHSHTGD